MTQRVLDGNNNNEKKPKQRQTRIVWAISEYFFFFFVVFFNINKCFILYIGKKTLNHYYNKTNHSEVYRITMGTCFYYSVIKFSYMLLVLHPRHKLTYFENAGQEDEWADRAKEIVRDEFDKSYGSLDASWAVQPSKSNVRAFLLSFFY